MLTSDERMVISNLIDVVYGIAQDVSSYDGMHGCRQATEKLWNLPVEEEDSGD